MDDEIVYVHVKFWDAFGTTQCMKKNNLKDNDYTYKVSHIFCGK